MTTSSRIWTPFYGAGLPPPSWAIDWDWLRVPAGEYLMGSPEDEDGRFPDEHQHLVTVDEGLWIADACVMKSHLDDLGVEFDHEVTKAPSGAATSLSWFDAQRVIAALQERLPGYEVRLPLEHEWERAAREFGPEGWLGNVWQWQADVYRERHDEEASRRDLEAERPDPPVAPVSCAGGPSSTSEGSDPLVPYAGGPGIANRGSCARRSVSGSPPRLGSGVSGSESSREEAERPDPTSCVVGAGSADREFRVQRAVASSSRAESSPAGSESSPTADSDRALRGGSWFIAPPHAAFRLKYLPTNGYVGFGFRVVVKGR